jgi:hypothetical protein
LKVLPPYRLEERFRSGSQTPTTNGDQDNDQQQLQQQLHHQQQLQQAQFAAQFLQCSLCSEIMPTLGYPKHLQEFHRVSNTWSVFKVCTDTGQFRFLYGPFKTKLDSLIPDHLKTRNREQ